MKAIALLLCLALTRDIAGSIFRHEYYPQRDRLTVQQLDYNDQQSTTRNEKTHQEYNHKYHHHHSSSGSSESKEKPFEDMNNDYATIQSVKNWNTPLFSAIINPDNARPTYGDVITWKGVQFAAGPNSPVSDQKDIEKIFKEAYNTMKHFTEAEKKAFHAAYQTAHKIENEDVHLNSSQLLKKYQYHVEEYTVKTDDGYFLNIFRILPKQYEDVEYKKDKPVVFLAHGLLGSSDDWLLMGPKKSLAYMLSDEGYEVWLGNTRGNKYAKRHASKHPAQPDFWQYSNDEVALHDTPAMIDYALKISEQKKLYYVGVSEGATTIFALMASRPEYNEKIASVHAISPMVYMTKVRSPLLRMIAPNSPFYERLEYQLGRGEFKPSKELIQTLGGDMCEREIGCKNVCSNVYFVMSSVGDVDVELIPVIMGHHPTGGSTRQMQQYGQAVASHEFRKFDYGPEINQKVYGTVQPPKFDMSKVQVPVALYSSKMDWLSHPDDVERLYRELPNAKDHYMVADDQFTNMDFLFSKKAPQFVYERLIENIKQDSTM
ncbi:unnamed protein product [Parnassius mnemosyne]|uniref:Partial AB-hydrolase lipase domain-containing protein n=1 Tax=Parnassius mnemosyne TaxID=213953 RepID=A0AAV1KSS3_9NEOP